MTNVLIKNGYIITIDKQRRVIPNGSVYIEDNKIVSVGNSEDVQKDLPTPDIVIDAKHKVVLPGFVNIHAHLPAHHLRGVYGRGMGGLYDITFPMTKYIRIEDSYLYAMASCAEVIYAGSTTIVATHRNDTKDFDEFAKAIDDIGLRGILGEIIPEVDLYKLKDNVYEYHPDVAEAALKRSISFFKKWHMTDDGRIKTILAPHAPDITTADTFIKCKEASEKYNMDITTHLSQTWQEVMQVKKKYGKTPTELLRDIGVLNDRLSVAHFTYASDKDTMILRDSGAKILHCRAVLNPLLRWIDIGIPVGLGTDDISHSMNELMRQNIAGSKFRARAVGGANQKLAFRPTPLELLEMATIKGAEVMGIANEVGSLEVGKKADIIMYDMKNPLLTPTVDPLASIVLYGTASDIDTVIIDGKIRKEKGVLTPSSMEDVLYQAQDKVTEMWTSFLKDNPQLLARLKKHIPYIF